MKVDLLNPRDLSDSQVETWTKLCLENSHLDSPYFCPEFAIDVAAERDDARVAVFYHEDAGPAFFSFQQSGRTGRPIGGRLSDYQALIAPPGYPMSSDEMLDSLGLSCLHFDHLVDPDQRFAESTEFTDQSPFADLSGGFEAYRNENAAVSREMKETMRKQRKLEREAGELEFRMVDTSEEAWDALIAWKSQQYISTNVTNVMGTEWVQRLLRRFVAREGDEFRGVISSLSAGGSLVAVHLGILSKGVLHYWFPAYEPTELAAKCSPGRVLLLEMSRAADQFPLKKIDFGRGVSRQKASAMSGATVVSVGVMDRRPIHRALRHSLHHTKNWLKQSPLKYPLYLPARAVYRIREWIAFR